jgi:hypothetical protein
VGAAYEANFLLGRTEDTTNEYAGEEDHFAAAVEWAEKRGADIISASLGYSDWYDWYDLDGTVSVCSRGTCHNDLVLFQASL